MPHQLFQLPKATLFSSGVLQPGWTVEFFLTTTTTPTPVYTTSALDPGSVHTQPVEADAAGILAAIYLDPTISYKASVYNAAGGLAYTIDPVNDSLLTAESIGEVLHPITPGEQSAAVTPTSYQFAPGNSERLDVEFDGSTDDRAGLVQLLAAAEAGADKYAGLVVRLTADYVASPTYASVSDGISYDPALLTLDGQGHTLDFTTKTSGAFSGVKLDSALDVAEPNAQAMYTSTKELRNLMISMPSYLVNASGVGLEVVDSTGDGGGSYRTNCGKVRNVAVMGGKYGVKLGHGVFGWEFENFVIGNEAGHNLDTAIYSIAGRIDHEFDKFRGGFIFNCLRAYDFDSGYALISDQNIDGARTIGRLVGTGYLRFCHGYSEFVDGDNTVAKFIVNDANAIIEADGWVFNTRPDILAARTIALATCAAGTLILRNCTFLGQNTAWYTGNGGFLVDDSGGGTVVASGLIYKAFEWSPLVSKNLQWLAYPDVDNADALAAFALSNVGAGDNPVRATSISDGSSTRDAVHFKINTGGVANDESVALFSHAVQPGHLLSIILNIYAPGITGSNTRLIALVTMKDVDGNTLGSAYSEVLTSTTIANWTTKGISLRTPKGVETCDVRLYLEATGAVGADKSVYISPIGIGYADGI
jgi:hypothetical protein